MKYSSALILFLFLSACNEQKKTSSEKQTIKISLEDSIEKQVNQIEGNMSVKIRQRIQYLPGGGSIQLQKFYAYGDTNQTIKVREHTETDDNVYVVQYYFSGDILYYIHDYSYMKHCPDYKAACMKESKYYFTANHLHSALKREAISPDGTTYPTITNTPFSAFTPSDSLIEVRKKYLEVVNTRFKTLPDLKKK
jgi:hypothetical protein